MHCFDGWGDGGGGCLVLGSEGGVVGDDEIFDGLGVGGYEAERLGFILETVKGLGSGDLLFEGGIGTFEVFKFKLFNLDSAANGSGLAGLVEVNGTEEGGENDDNGPAKRSLGFEPGTVAGDGGATLASWLAGGVGWWRGGWGWGWGRIL